MGLAKPHGSEESEKIWELSTNVVYKLFAFYEPVQESENV